MWKRTLTLVLAPAASVLLVACGSADPGGPASGAPGAAASSSPSSVPAPAPTAPAPTGPASPGPSGEQDSELVLGGTDLGVTMLGAPFPQAVAAVTAVLGAPIEDPANGVSCIPSTREVEWEGFRLAEGTGGVAAGWTSSSPSLQTPSGVTIGTDLATLERVYDAGFRVYPPNTDNPRRTFEVEDADVLGGLSDEDTVETLYSSFCSGP